MLFCMRSRGELNLFRLLGYFPEGKGYPGTGVGRPDTQARRLSLDPQRRRAGVRHGVRRVDNPYDDTPRSQREGAAPRASRLLFE